MDKKEILKLRIRRQGLCPMEFTQPKDVVGWMGAMQAQNFQMSKWAVGMRMVEATSADIERELDKGTILRTHVLRPTWHLVRAEDLLWMLKLTAPNVGRLLNSSNKLLGITAKDLVKAEKAIQKLMEDSAAALKREDLLAALQACKIQTDGSRGMHILMHAELVALICSGAVEDNQTTYALTGQRLAGRSQTAQALAANLSRQEALAKLAQLYFQSRGPATLKDFAWWSGLNLTDAKSGLMAIASHLETIKGLDQPYYYMTVSIEQKAKSQACHFIPAFDEYLISYKDRSAAIEIAHHPKAFTKNGIFWPVLLYHGRAIGTWEKTSSQKGLSIRVHTFDGVDTRLRAAASKALKHYAHFMQMPLHNLSITA